MSHYYGLDGESRHDVVGANGKIRPTTVADARKLGLFPSVSTVKETGVSYGLLDWMMNLLLDQSIENPFHPHEYDSIEEYKKRIFSKYHQIKSQPAEKGNEIHSYMDEWYKSGKIVNEQYVTPVLECLNNKFGKDVIWVSEASFVSPLGYAGRVDLHSKTHNIVVDFKTKDKEDIKSIKAYDDQKMQLSAYQEGLGLSKETKRYNCFISTAKGHEGECNLVEAKDHDKPWAMFLALFEFWKIRNNYDPRSVFNTID